MSLDRDDVLRLIKPEAFDELRSRSIAKSSQEQRDYKSEIEIIDIENRREKQQLRRKWDKLLGVLVVIGFILSYLMIFLIGTNALSFAHSAFAVPSVIAVGIFQTYGLAKLAVGYFFSDDGGKEK